MHSIEDHAEHVLVAVTAVCLFTFLATIPLPRVDDQLLGSDGIRYYVYLPSVLLDGDLDFTDEYRYFMAHDADRLEVLVGQRTPRGIPANQWPIGPALFWSPFFLLGHLWALALTVAGLAVATNGYGYLYQAAVLSGSILYGGGALVLTYWFVRELVPRRAALTATILVSCAGNLVYYMTAEPFMSHTVSAFASSLLLYVWIRCRHALTGATAALYGVLGGAMALVRPQDGLFLMLPFVAALPSVWRGFREGDPASWRAWAGNLAIASFVALVTFSPQLWVWGRVYGDYLRSSYLYASEAGFYWASPALGAVLFSAYRGLFTWHPVFLLALIGLVLALKVHPLVAGMGALGFVSQWYVISSWHNWMQGDAFGGRMFIVCFPLFTFGLAHLVERVRRWRSWSYVYAGGGLLLIWNFLLFVEYRFDLITAQHMPNWSDLTVRRVTFLVDLLQRLLK